jgi:hypothetical protein
MVLEFRFVVPVLVLLVLTMLVLEWMQVSNSSVSQDLAAAVRSIEQKVDRSNQLVDKAWAAAADAKAAADAAALELKAAAALSRAEATRATAPPVTAAPKLTSRHFAAPAQTLAPYGKRFHFVFSSDCRWPPKAHWQSVALLKSFFDSQMASAVITEVISCHDTAWQPYWFDHLTPAELARTRYWVAPTRNPHPITKDEYAPQNKPFGLRNWNDFVGGPHDDDIVVLTDWDNIYVRPFPLEALTEVRDGFPQGALYGLGMGWATNEIANTVCPDWCPNKTDDERNAVGAIGPPHAWTAHDFRQMLPLWQNYTEWIRSDQTSREVGGWTSDMYAYMITALRLGYRHTIHASWMLSSSHPYEWDHQRSFTPPVVLHYCQTYRVGEWHFYKYDISFYDALACDFPLLAEPPRLVGNASDIAEVNTADIWIAHSLVMYVNNAFVWYKRRACRPDWPAKLTARWQPKSDTVGESHNSTQLKPGP